MTYQTDCTLSREILETITAGGIEGLLELIRILEQEQHLGQKRRNPRREDGAGPRTVRHAGGGRPLIVIKGDDGLRSATIGPFLWEIMVII